MKIKSCILSLLMSSGIFLTAAAQNNIPACGSNASGSGGSVSYSYGQTVYSALPGSNGSAIQGVQQPYEISIITAVEETEGICLTATAYPNPAQTYLVLSIEGGEHKSLSYRLTASDGRLLQAATVEDNITRLNIESVSTGLYFLMVFDGSREVKTFKIIKN
jgi:hypothetical protein